jgi:hypothetical protein
VRPVEGPGKDLHDARGTSAFFSRNGVSGSTLFGGQELMGQAYYQAVLIPWGLALEAAYSSIPKPGVCPDVSSAHALTLRLIALF